MYWKRKEKLDKYHKKKKMYQVIAKNSSKK
jgi:hypothetical protein